MQNYENKYVRVSDIVAYLICPRMAFFRLMRRERGENVKKEMIRAVAYSLQDVISEGEPLKSLYDSISAAQENARLIYGEAAKENIGEAGKHLLERAPDIINGLKCEEKAGLIDYLSGVTPETIYSSKLKMSGTIDRIFYRNENPVPAFISAALPPEKGIYLSDRVRVAAYAMLLEDGHDREVKAGYVEYFYGWERREARVRSPDRWTVLMTRDRVRKAMEGRMPGEKRGEWCHKCDYKVSCSPRASFLDRLLER